MLKVVVFQVNTAGLFRKGFEEASAVDINTMFLRSISLLKGFAFDINVAESVGGSSGAKLVDILLL